MIDDLAEANASGTFLKLRKFIFYFGRNLLYCISFANRVLGEAFLGSSFSGPIATFYYSSLKLLFPRFP